MKKTFSISFSQLHASLLQKLPNVFKRQLFIAMSYDAKIYFIYKRLEEIIDHIQRALDKIITIYTTMPKTNYKAVLM